eukprot:6461365-Pyramimonas_sp.AAC.1
MEDLLDALNGTVDMGVAELGLGAHTDFTPWGDQVRIFLTRAGDWRVGLIALQIEGASVWGRTRGVVWSWIVPILPIL